MRKGLVDRHAELHPANNRWNDGIGVKRLLLNPASVPVLKLIGSADDHAVGGYGHIRNGVSSYVEGRVGGGLSVALLSLTLALLLLALGKFAERNARFGALALRGRVGRWLGGSGG